MIRISVRVDPDLHERLQRRAAGAELSFSTFIRSVLEQAADPRGRYIYSSQDEILATCIQILTILGTSEGQRNPDLLQKGMSEARLILRDRGLLAAESDR